MVLTSKVLGAALLAVSLPGAVMADESDAAPNAESVWNGVYNAAQAERGQVIYASICGRCHGYRLDGAPDDPDMLPAPPIAGRKFLREWNGASLGSLYEYVRMTMPAINPGSLSDSEYADILSYMLESSGFPAGAAELQPAPEVMAVIVIEPQP